ncbi:MAG: hypothetical protein IT458_01860 [Planctomycetes bacterium]|nr:hypothetical protein [Planctomycetota bacterium]
MGGHRHIADEIQGAGALPASKLTPLLNKPDGQWNLGEGFPADTGGVLSRSNPAQLNLGQPPDYQVQSGGWIPTEDSGIVRWVGRLRPGSAQPPEPPDPDAVFEIRVPSAWVTDPQADRKKALIVVCAIETFGPVVEAEEPYAPHKYPGDPGNPGAANNYGLGRRPGLPDPKKLIDHVETSNPKPEYRIAYAWITPRTSFQPLVFQVQRLRELRRVVRHILTQPPISIPDSDANFAYLINGYSMGGFVTQCLLMLYPDEFHGGVASSYTPNQRGLVDDQNSHAFVSAMLGQLGSGAGYTARSAADWSIFCRLEQTDYQSLSLVNRVAWGHLYRPTYVLTGDEDPVSHGADWMPILTQSAGPEQTYHYARLLPGGPPQARLYVSVFSKTCHGTEPGLFKIPTSPDATSWVDAQDPQDALHFLLPIVWNERGKSAPSAGSPALPRMVGKHSSLGVLEPHEHFNTKAPRAFTAPSPGLLSEAPGFRRHGHGLFPRALLAGVAIPGEDRHSIYAGNADGTIYRFKMETRGTGSATIQPLVQQAVSRNAQGDVYELGAGIRSLTFAEVDGSGPGAELVAATHRRIAAFRRDTLQHLWSHDLSSVRSGWESQGIACGAADLHPAAGDEVLVSTVHGKLLILQAQAGGLTVLGEHEDCGSAPVVGPSPGMRLGSQTVFTKPVLGWSARGHLFSLELNSSLPMPNQGLLGAVSALQYGGLADMAFVPWPGVPGGLALAGLFLRKPAETGSIRIFDPSTLDLITHFGDVTAPEDPYNKEQPFFFPNLPRGGTSVNLRYVGDAGPSGPCLATSYSGGLVLWNLDGSTRAVKSLDSFPPFRGATSLIVANVAPAAEGDELVVSTAGGRIGFLTHYDLTYQPGTDLQLPRRFWSDPATGQVFEDRCTMSLAGTWALAEQGDSALPHFEAIDRAGTWWKVDRMTGHPIVSPPPADIGIEEVRGLVWSGAGNPPVQGPKGSNYRKTYMTVGPVSFLSHGPYVHRPEENDPLKWDLVDPELDPFSPPYPPDRLLYPTLWRGGFWICPKGGGARTFGAARHAAWWSSGPYPNLVSFVRLDNLSGTPNVADAWNSMGTSVGNSNRRPPLTGPYRGLRSEFNPCAVNSNQSLVLGRVHPDQNLPPQVILVAMGGRVVVLDGATGAILAESPDLGIGGCALAVGNLDGDPQEEIVVAPLFSNNGAGGAPMRSSVYVLKYHDSANPTLQLVSQRPVGTPGTALPGYGACGLAITNLDADPANEVLVTTLHGELVVFPCPGGNLGTPLLQNVYEGSLGAYNSILLEDRVAPAGKPERIYIAGSAGIRCFVVQ